MLLHISDPHFGTEQPPVVEALVRLAQQQQPELVLLSGDITQRARQCQFRAARRFLDRLGAPILAIPGNHDIPLFNLAARVFAPYANYVREFGRDMEPVYDSARLLAIALNTTRAYRHKNGEISVGQVERVVDRLQRAGEGQLRIVAVHQPIEVMHEEDECNRLRGHSRSAIEQWSRAGADLVLGGHIHLPYVIPLHERHEGLFRRMWVVQAGTALSRRIRGGIPNSVNLVRWAGPLPRGVCEIERWDYSGRCDAFERNAVHEIAPGMVNAA